jgi:hypothetical protein
MHRLWRRVDSERERVGGSCTPHPTHTPPTIISEMMILRVRVEIMGSQKYRIVGKSQPVLIMINPIISTRRPLSSPGWRQNACRQAFDREVHGQGWSGMQASSSRVSKAGCDVAAHAPTLEAVGDSPLLTALSASWAIEACSHHRKE